MKPHELIRLIKQGESQTLDFKKTISHARKIAKSLVAFANTRGGTLLIGVMDDRQIIGVDPEEERYIIQEAAEHYCKPSIQPQYLSIEVQPKQIVLAVIIPESKQKPHYALSQENDWQAYIRMNDKSVLASKAVILNLGQSSQLQKVSLDRNEKTLVSHLKKHERITGKAFAKLINVSERRATKILTSLVRERILFQHDFEKETFYSLA